MNKILTYSVVSAAKIYINAMTMMHILVLKLLQRYRAYLIIWRFWKTTGTIIM